MSIRNFITFGSNLASVTDCKRLQTPPPPVYAEVLEDKKPLELVGQAAEFKIESTFEPIPVIWQSIPKAVQAIQGLEGKFNGQALGAAPRAQAQLVRVGWASTNTRSFLVSGSPCWPRKARLKKTCYHSRDTDSVRVKKVLMLCRYRAATSHFFFI